MSLASTPKSRSHRFARNRFAHLSIRHSITAVFLLLLGGTALGVAQDAKPVAVQNSTPVKQVHVMRPSNSLRDFSELHASFGSRATLKNNLTPVNTGPGIVYTCDPNVAAATCNYLNTTVAGWYNSTFTNANANIYILYGNTGLGSSSGYGNTVTYDQYIAAVNSNKNKSEIQTSALSALSTYDAGPYGGGDVGITGALGTALGFTGLYGTTVPGQPCTLGTSGCYNEVITITNDPGTPLYYDNLGGPEPSDAYDFYGVVAHETDEVLGTSSCISTQDPNRLTDECGAGTPSAVDLFRYSSAGELVLDSTLSTKSYAYFSYDGGSTNGVKSKSGGAKIYNTLDNGDDYADFLSSTPDCGTDIVVQDAEGCPGEDAGLSILNDGGGEINILNAVGFDVPPPVSACVAPSSAGVNVCAPTQGEVANSPVTFIASGTGASGSVNHLELWIDGTKIANYSGSTMDAKVSEAAGSHTATVIEVDSKGNYVKSAPITYTVGETSGCAAPTSPGVNVCEPTQGEDTSSPVTFIATGTGASGAVNHLELWIDGNKIGVYSGATMDASVHVAAGGHTATVIEVDSDGHYVKSSPVDFTVGAISCAAPSSPGVDVCSPNPGSKDNSPVTFIAAGTGASGAVNHLELWIDGTKIGNYSGSAMDASITESAGSHTATVIEVDTKGNYVKSTPVTYTVN